MLVFHFAYDIVFFCGVCVSALISRSATLCCGLRVCALRLLCTCMVVFLVVHLVTRPAIGFRLNAKGDKIEERVELRHSEIRVMEVIDSACDDAFR